MSQNLDPETITDDDINIEYIDINFDLARPLSTRALLRKLTTIANQAVCARVDQINNQYEAGTDPKTLPDAVMVTTELQAQGGFTIFFRVAIARILPSGDAPGEGETVH